MKKVALIGAGNVGRIRANLIRSTPNCRLRIVADVEDAPALQVAKSAGAEATTDWLAATSAPDVDLVVICTPTKFHAQAARNALQHGKHVLCEKPLARSVSEAQELVEIAEQSGLVLKTGFNYRYMGHIQKAKELIDSGVLGPLYFARCRYGHGGRPGYEKSWCTDLELSGGGVLLEQGIHILDLVRFLLGEPARVMGLTTRFFWDFPAVEDNCFLLLETESCQVAQLHVSWTQWINVFSLEVFGQNGYLFLTGRDGHYGPQRLVWGRRQQNHSRPTEEQFDFPADESWKKDWDDFLNAVHNHREPMGGLVDGLQSLRLVEAAYQSAEKREWVNVQPLSQTIGSCQ